MVIKIILLLADWSGLQEEKYLVSLFFPYERDLPQHIFSQMKLKLHNLGLKAALLPSSVTVKVSNQLRFCV